MISQEQLQELSTIIDEFFLEQDKENLLSIKKRYIQKIDSFASRKDSMYLLTIEDCSARIDDYINSIKTGTTTEKIKLSANMAFMELRNWTTLP